MARSVKRALCAALSLVTLTGVASAGSSAPASGSSSATQATARSPWKVVPSPNVGTLANALAGVAALSSIDAWAVGTSRFIPPGQAPVGQTLTEHWNGSAWSVVASPNVGTGDNDLFSVAASSPTDAWAVGTFFDYPSLAWHTLILHWNGIAWSVVPSPNPSTRYNALQSVAVAGANDVWAVGIEQTSYPSINNRTLIEHWNGTAWSVVPSPNVGSENNYLLGVAVVSPSDIWAVGNHDSQTLTEHWDGVAWSVVGSPNSGAQANTLRGVTVLSAGDVWAVGAVYPGGGAPQRTLAEHWNGTSWSIVATPNVGTGNNELAAVAALSGNDVWAAGSFDGGGNNNRTLTERWNGSTWTVVASPSPGAEAYLAGLAALPVGTVWAVGAFEEGADKTLILRATQGGR